MMKTLTSLILFIAVFGLSAISRAQEIHEAARNGDLIKLKALLEQDPQLANARNRAGRTPLFDAVMIRHIEIAQYLIERGADVNARDSFHRTLLHVVLGSKTPLEVVRILVEKGADINADSKYQGTPLDLAYEAGDSSVIQYLLSKQAKHTPLELQVVSTGSCNMFCWWIPCRGRLSQRRALWRWTTIRTPRTPEITTRYGGHWS